MQMPVPADAISRNISPRELDRKQSKRALNELEFAPPLELSPNFYCDFRSKVACLESR